MLHVTVKAQNIDYSNVCGMAQENQLGMLVTISHDQLLWNHAMGRHVSLIVSLHSVLWLFFATSSFSVLFHRKLLSSSPFNNVCLLVFLLLQHRQTARTYQNTVITWKLWDFVDYIASSSSVVIRVNLIFIAAEKLNHIISNVIWVIYLSWSWTNTNLYWHNYQTLFNVLYRLKNYSQIN